MLLLGNIDRCGVLLSIWTVLMQAPHRGSSERTVDLIQKAFPFLLCFLVNKGALSVDYSFLI